MRTCRQVTRRTSRSRELILVPVQMARVEFDLQVFVYGARSKISQLHIMELKPISDRQDYLLVWATLVELRGWNGTMGLKFKCSQCTIVKIYRLLAPFVN